MSTARRRTAHAEAILGPELHARLPDVKVLLVGAGGIGCELRALLHWSFFSLANAVCS